MLGEFLVSDTLFNFEGPPGNSGWTHPAQTCEYGGVAQLGEHLPCKQGVDSSILFVSTTSGRDAAAHRSAGMAKNGHRHGLIAQVVRARA